MPYVFAAQSSGPSPPGLVESSNLQKPAHSLGGRLELSVGGGKTVVACPKARRGSGRPAARWPSNADSGCKRSSPVARRPVAPSDWETGKESLRSSMNEIDVLPVGRIFLVRRIHQLGFGSQDIVQAHFKRYGRIERVHVAHSPIFSVCGRYVRRLRPSNLAIVVAESASTVEAVHRDGSEHFVQGTCVVVEHYVRRADGKARASFSSTSDGDSSGDIHVISSDDAEDASISGDFEYFATDDEWL